MWIVHSADDQHIPRSALLLIPSGFHAVSPPLRLDYAAFSTGSPASIQPCLPSGECGAFVYPIAANSRAAYSLACQCVFVQYVMISASLLGSNCGASSLIRSGGMFNALGMCASR